MRKVSEHNQMKKGSEYDIQNLVFEVGPPGLEPGTP